MNYKNYQCKPMLLPTLVLFLALTGCSGGGDSVAGGGIGGSGITVSAVSVGAVTNFGSVIVNDVEFDTVDAEVVVNGEVQGTGDAAVTSALSRGMVVRVEGRLDTAKTGTAARVVFSDNIEGPVETILPLDASATELVIMGQTVHLDDGTVFQNVTLGSIGVGNLLNVSGLVGDAGTIFASYVNKKAENLAPNSAVRVKGTVQNLNTTAGRFTIGSLTIDYPSATVTGFSGAAPLPGSLVKVKGHLTDPDTLFATSVGFENQLGRDDVDTADVEGFITQVTSISRFSLGTISVVTDGNTIFKDLASEDLSLGTRLKVRGSVNERILFADEVALADKVKLESDVDSVNLGESIVTLSGLAPVVIHINSFTKFTGVSDLSQIVPGSHVKVFARASASGEVIATKVLEKPGSGTVGLKGSVESKSQPSLQVLGVTIDTAFNIPPGAFLGKDGRSISDDEFFSTLQLGDMVNVEGTLTGQQVIWNRISNE